MRQRSIWLDQLKGLAVALGAILYLLPMMMKDFNPQGFFQSDSVDFVRGLRFYLPMGLVLISGFGLYFHSQFSSKWWITKFSALVVLSSWLYMIGQDESHYYSMMIPCLFFYYPLFWYLKKKTGLEKVLLNLLIGLSYFIGLKLSPAMVSMPVGGSSLTDAGAWQLIWFNLLSGLPMVMIGSYLVPWLLENKTLNQSRLNQAIIGLSVVFLADYLLYQYLLTFPVTSGYPPMLRQTWMGALAVLGAIKGLSLLPQAPLKPLQDLGRNSLVNFWTLWLFGTLIISWNSLGKYQFNLMSGLGLLLIILVAFAVIKSKLTKSGIN